MKFTALELILHLADGSTTPNTLQHIAKIARETLDALKEQEAFQPYKDMTNADYLRGHREGRKLAQPEQEPVAWIDVYGHVWGHKTSEDDVPLYATPPKREWVGLTDDEIEQGCKESWVTEQAFQSAVWWAETKLTEKNT